MRSGDRIDLFRHRLSNYQRILNVNNMERIDYYQCFLSPSLSIFVIESTVVHFKRATRIKEAKPPFVGGNTFRLPTK